MIDNLLKKLIGSKNDRELKRLWAKVQFINDLEPWGGILADAPEPEKRHSVVVEVEGKRVSVSLPTKLLPSNGSVSTMMVMWTGSSQSSVTEVLPPLWLAG